MKRSDNGLTLLANELLPDIACGDDTRFFIGKGMSWLTAGFGDGENSPEACMGTERRRTMARIHG